jgi:hypothetical protein
LQEEKILKIIAGMQLLEKYKEKLDVLSEGHSSPSSNSQQRPFARNVEFLLIFFR